MKEEISDFTEPENEVVPRRVGAPPGSPRREQGFAHRPSTRVMISHAAADESAVRRIKDLPREFGVMLVSVGALGVVLPGLMGAPALVAGGARPLAGYLRRAGRMAQAPESRSLSSRHASSSGRFLDDLERRYPRSPSRPGQGG